MPLTETGKKVKREMVAQYGSKDKGERVFYASMNKGKPGSSKWHGKRSMKKRAPVQRALTKGR